MYERDADALVECQRHESLLNVAFADGPAFWLVCPYDTHALDPGAIHGARCSHPVVANGGGRSASDAWDGLDAVAARFRQPLPDPPASAEKLRFEGLDAHAALRRLVAERAAEAGIDPLRTNDLLVAVTELTTNSVLHAGGGGLLRVWREPGALVCEVRDSGHIADPLVGRRRPPLSGPAGGWGVWLMNQLCDLVQVRSDPVEAGEDG